MIRQISDYTGISKKELKKQGVFNAILGVDTRLFVDPYLLKECKIPEFSQSYVRIQDFFSKIFKLLKKNNKKGDIFWLEADKLINFREPAYLCIGYAKGSSHGTALGPQLRDELLSTAKEILDAGHDEPEIFELVGLFQKNMGPDRISDLTCHIIREDIARYTEKIIKSNNIPPIMTIDIIIGEKKYKSLKYVHGKKIRQMQLLPNKIIRELPVALDWSDIDRITFLNQATRDRLNQIVGETWKQASRLRKEDLREAIIGNPELLDDLIQKYRAKKADPYDLESDKEGLSLWAEVGREIAVENPLGHIDLAEKKLTDLFSLVLKISEKFRDLVENNKLRELLFYKGKHRREEFSQLLLYAVADIYCSNYNVDVSREANAGRGPVDFKFSNDYKTKVLLEVKLSTNAKLEEGFSKQLHAYELSEKSKNSVYLIIIVDDKSAKYVEDYKDKFIQSKDLREGMHELVIVDARPKPSASQL